MALRKELVKTAGAVAFVALHCIGGDRYAPSATTAVTVASVQLLSLLLALFSHHAEQTAARRAEKLAAVKQAAHEPSAADTTEGDESEETSALAAPAPVAEEQEQVASPQPQLSVSALVAALIAAACNPISLLVLGALLLAGVAKLVHRAGLLGLPLLMAAAFLSGGAARRVLEVAQERREGGSHSYCQCNVRCGSDEVCPYSREFWADLPEITLESEQ